MRLFNLPVKVMAFFVLFFAFLTPSRADKIPVRGGSTYGDNTGFGTCVDNINNFLKGESPINCEGFTAAVFTIDGNSYSGATFAFLEPGGTASGILDIILLGGNSSLTLTLLNPSLPTGVFMCGSFGADSTVAQDSTPTDMTGLPCTAGSSSTDYLNLSQEVANVQAIFSPTGVTFINENLTGIAVFTEHGNIQTPEPGSLMLLGVGLLTVIRQLRRPS